MAHSPRLWASLVALATSLVPLAASAQSLDYDDLGGGDEAAEEGSSAGKGRRDSNGSGRQGTHVSAYIEAQQVLTAQLSPGNDSVTYTRVAVGGDATIAGRNNAASVSLRYSREFGWGDAPSSDTISGVLRGYASIIPQTLRIDAGVLATRTRIEDGGAALNAGLAGGNSATQVYSAYAGPTLTGELGDARIDAHYRIGYTKVDAPDVLANGTVQPSFDRFDESVAHDAGLHIGTRPGTVLPVGIGAGVGYYREDISNLDQRIEDKHARLDFTLPVSRDLAFAAGVGYEDVTISGRDALRDANGMPVVVGNRYATDKSLPRQIAYQSEGLTWDAGVIWKPSRRTQLEAHVGRRYGTISYFGSFSYAPNERSAFNVAIYDSISGFGGKLNRALVDLPAEFTANRNPLTGDLSGCVDSLEKGNCLTGVLGSVRSATFRSRGIAANYNIQLGHLSAGIGAGYDRRKFIAAPGTVLAVANGVIDESYWLSAFAAGRIDRASGYRVNVYANWFQSGSSFAGDSSTLGATLAYYRNLTDHLEASAALGIDTISRSAPFEGQTNASALLGLRYNF